MLRSILVPLDGSPLSESAMPWAARFARRAHGRIRLVMTHQPASVLMAAGGPAGPDEAEPATRAASYLDRTAAQWRATSGVPVDCELREGEPGSTLVAAAGAARPDLVVVARQRQDEVGGADVEALDIGRMPGPVLLVRPRAGRDLAVPSTEIRRLLVPLDRAPESEAILEPAGVLANVAQAHVTLFTVVSGGARPADRAAVASAQRYLDRVADRLRAAGHRVAARVVADPDPAGAVLAELRTGRYDLVAVRARGGSADQGADLGPVANQIVLRSEKPVLLLA